MSSDALRVTTAHLQELAATHSRAAAEMMAAGHLVAGVEGRVRNSHGMVALPTAHIVGRIEEIRHIAGRRVSAESHALRWSLDSMAHAYIATDSVSGQDMDRFLR